MSVRAGSAMERKRSTESVDSAQAANQKRRLPLEQFAFTGRKLSTALKAAVLPAPPTQEDNSRVVASNKAILETVTYQYNQLRKGRLLKRYKRFLADVVFDDEGETDGAVVVVHCPNTGPMVGLLDRPESPVYCSVSSNTKRKYAHTLEMIQPEPDGAWVGIHSASANSMVRKMLLQHAVPGLPPYQEVQAEVFYGGGKESRADFLLSKANGCQTFVEVKSVTLTEAYEAEQREHGVLSNDVKDQLTTNGDGVKKIALFPDTVSERAQRHVQTLMEAVDEGHQAVCIFVIQRDDCQAFAPCYEKDPKYANLLAQAHAKGVGMIALCCQLSPADKTVRLKGPVPVYMDYKQVVQEGDPKKKTGTTKKKMPAKSKRKVAQESRPVLLEQEEGSARILTRAA